MLLALTIIEMIAKYGPNATIVIADALKSGKRTPEEIKLLFIDKNPEDYFK